MRFDSSALRQLTAVCWVMQLRPGMIRFAARGSLPGEISQRAWRMVKGGEAASYSDALSRLGKHGAQVRVKARRTDRVLRSAQDMWWNK
jgi:hypothetical protein